MGYSNTPDGVIVFLSRFASVLSIECKIKECFMECDCRKSWKYANQQCLVG